MTPTPKPAATPARSRKRASEVRPLTRSEKMKAALAAKRAALPDPGFHPCLWCGGEISADRCKDALSRNKQPRYCSEPCRKNEPRCSLVHRIYAQSMGAHRSDEALWERIYRSSVAAALLPPSPSLKKAAAARGKRS